MSYSEDNIKNVIKNEIHFDKENEFRFGKFINGKFNPGITYKSFIKLNEYFEKNTDTLVEEYSLNVLYKDNYRVKQVLTQPNNCLQLSYPWMNAKVIETKVEQKMTIKKIDNKEYNYRFSVSEEKEIEKIDLTKDEPILYKIRKRKSFIGRDFRIDLDMFQMTKDLNNLDEIQFSIELEVKNKDAIIWVDKIISIIQNNYYGYILSNSEINKILDEYKQLTKNLKIIQPVPIRESRIPEDELAITLKLDGERKILFINSIGEYYLIDKQENVIKYPCKVGNTNTLSPEIISSVLDTEWTYDNIYIFDIIIFNKRDLRQTKENLKERLEIINKHFKENHNIKEYYFGDFKENAIKIITSHSFNKKYDGIILIPVEDPYPYSNKESRILKWKPINSIDCKIKKSLDKFEFELYVNGKDNKQELFKTISVTPEIYKKYFDGMVLEFDNDFYPIRIRYDKIEGNYIDIANDNYSLMQNNYSFFDEYKRYLHYVKRQILYTYVKGKKLLDLNCEKGSDIQKWIDFNIKNVIALTQEQSLDELNEKNKKINENKITKNFNFTFKTNLVETDLEQIEIIVNFNKNENFDYNLFEKYYEQKNVMIISFYQLENLSFSQRIPFDKWYEEWKTYKNKLPENLEEKIKNEYIYIYNYNCKGGKQYKEEDKLIYNQLKTKSEQKEEVKSKQKESSRDFSKLKLKELKELCKEYGLKVSGTKDECIKRLTEYDSTKQ